MTNGVYNGTQGFVNRPTSVERSTPSLDRVYDYVESRGLRGVTWKEISRSLGLHHGQASGALSNLHRLGRVFVLANEKQERCQLYVADKWRNAWDDDSRVDSPAITKAGRRNIAVVDLADTVRGFLNANQYLSPEEWRLKLSEALENYEKESK